MNQTLSVCMIVKDEAAMLPRCLQSIQWADEVIVIDTGSTDDTIEIVQKAGARVFTLPWPGSFAAARNESLSHATGDWILVIDADEGLVPNAENQIRQLMEVDDALGYAVRIRNYLGSGNGGDADASEHYHVRLFRNKRHFRYAGIIHEQLISTDPDNPFDAFRYPGLLILHDGYKTDIFEAKGKQARNQMLLQQAVDDSPEDPYCWFNIAQNQWNGGELDRARLSLMTCISLCSDQSSYLPSAWIKYICLTNDICGPSDAWEIAIEAPESCGSNPDYWSVRASIAMALNNLTEAVRCFEKAAEMDRPDFECESNFDRSNMTWKPYAGIAQVQIKRGYPESAVVYLQKSLEKCPGNPMILQQLSEIKGVCPWLASV